MHGIRYIFVTGGVVSGIGKGITAASIGLLLKNSGLTVDAVKLDPYLNIDCGTMSPYEHGEVYVLNDGTEIDLDLGHYERFLDTHLTRVSSVTSGGVYSYLLDQERRGEFLGKTMQIIPHVTEVIKASFQNEFHTDVRIIEVGGTTGDIEGEVFLESMRQFRRTHKGEVLHIHLGYVPFLACSGEYKSKPMQLSLRELLRVGLQPDIVCVRNESTSDKPLPPSIIEKIALFANLDTSCVVSLPDLPSIYEIPLHLLKTSMTEVLSKHINKAITPVMPEFFDKWHTISQNRNTPRIKIALVTKYTALEDAYLSVIQASKIAGVHAGAIVDCRLVDSDRADLEEELQRYDGVIIPGGFGNRGLEGKIKAIHIARIHRIPMLGICLGLQMAIIEYLRNECELPDAVSREQIEHLTNQSEYTHVAVDYMPDQIAQEYLGATMRLGLFECHLEKGSIIEQLFQKEQTFERHRHRLEVQNKYTEILESHGMKISGKHLFNEDQYLVEMIELSTETHPYFVATQSHPEFLTSLNTPHPLFTGLIQATMKRKAK